MGLKQYKERLLQQLDEDCSKKLMVTNLLYLSCIFLLLALYFQDVPVFTMTLQLMDEML